MARRNTEPLKGKYAHSRNVEYAAPWRTQHGFSRIMPHEIWETLTPHAQKLCEWIKADPGVWPPGAGIMHPLASKRAEANEKSN